MSEQPENNFILAARLKRIEKYAEIRLIRQQVSLIYNEIQLREKMLQQLYDKVELLQKEAQKLSDILLEAEQEVLIKHNL